MMMTCSHSIRQLPPLPTITLALAGAILTIACGNSSNGDGSGGSGFRGDVVAAMAMEWVIVGDPGNACENQPSGPGDCFGSVDEPYRIGKFEVTNSQYVEFLNAVAATDTNALYHENMGVVTRGRGGIPRSGTNGNYTYIVESVREDWPVNWVSFWDAIRFANWMHNGQPTGAQDNTTTEDGAYTISVQGIADNSITRNVGATVFLPSEDEWYKAAYYNAGTARYFDYATGSNSQPTCTLPGTAPNTANCNHAVLLPAGVPPDVGNPTNVGSYTGSPSPYGTFDQVGNVWEWHDTRDLFWTTDRGLRGGGFEGDGSVLSSEIGGDLNPSIEDSGLGFRVASLPESAP